MSECYDPFADLPETKAAMDVADQECCDHTAEEYGFVAVLGQAMEYYRPMAEGGDLNALAMIHAGQIIHALFNDVNL